MKAGGAENVKKYSDRIKIIGKNKEAEFFELFRMTKMEAGSCRDGCLLIKKARHGRRRRQIYGGEKKSGLHITATCSD